MTTRHPDVNAGFHASGALVKSIQIALSTHPSTPFRLPAFLSLHSHCASILAMLVTCRYVWLLDTDAFLLGPLSYDPFRLMAIRNASYGYVDVNVETAEVS